MEKDNLKNEKQCVIHDVRCSCVSLAQVILRHGFPNGKDENYMPKFRMKNPNVDYVMNQELTKIIMVIEVNNCA